jgi:hypothetical protein
MKEMCVAYHPDYILTSKYLCIYDKKVHEYPIIVADLSGRNQYVGYHVSNEKFRFRKATEREIAEGLARRI